MAYGDSAAAEVSGGDSADPVTDKDGKLDLLTLVREEMRRAAGFDQDAELRADRERALLYFKGDVSADIPSLPNRSSAVSSDVSDAIETLLPDLIEIFIGGDDVVSFIPQKATDVEAAKQETAYLHHVAFQENPGFLNIYTAIKDALLLKTGVFHWEWEEEIEEQVEDFTGKNAVELQLAAQDGQISNVKDETPDIDIRTGEKTFSFTVTRTKDKSRAKYWAIAPDDFAATSDTVNIAETTYCCERQRPRVQDLIAIGFDEDKVRALPSYGADENQVMEQARDTAGEHISSGGGADDTSDDLRQVEIRKHCIRTLGEGNKLELWCIYTDEQAVTEIYREKITAIPYAVGSPYLVAHRLIGRSVADLLIEVMKLKTAFIRMVADSGYFAVNQRFEIADTGANSFTLSDLLRNEPMVPVRSKTGNAIRPINAGGLSFDAYKALEYFSTVAESRTGVVRNAQGLNPDTLHDTAKGAMMLLSAAQKRTRMIARVLAETLIKPLFLGLHQIIRENGKAASEAQLLGKWVQVDPTKWAERNAMTVEVGLGAAGKDAEIAAINSIAEDMKHIVEVQGGAQGPLVTLENVYKVATDKAKKLGVRAPEEYYTDPKSPEGQAAIQAMANKPDPETAKLAAESQLQQSKQQGEMQLGAAKVAAEKEIQNNKSQMQALADQHKQQLEHERELQKQADAMALEQLKLASEERIAITVARIKAEAQIEAARIASKADDGAAELARQESMETT
jgi:hypothetical protein